MLRNSRAIQPGAWIVGRCDVPLWGLSPGARWRRCFARAGIVDCRGEDSPFPDAGAVVLVRADHVLDESLVRGLIAAPGTVLTVTRPGGAGERVAVGAHVDARRAADIAALLRRRTMPAGDGGADGLAVVGPEDLASSYRHGLRKRAAPQVYSLLDESPESVERRMFEAAYKGATDFVTKWLWPAPALWVTRWAARHGVSPNAVTALSLVFVFLALGLFAAGHFLSGLAAAWVMTFLDTVDGKLARVTFASTPWGNAFDHGIDLVHPPFWYAAWWYGLHGAGDASILDAGLWIVVVGYVVGRLLEGLFIWRFGFETHVWRPLDTRFRLITARRNPNLALLTGGTAFGRPDLGFLAVALWTVLSLLVHVVRLIQALWRRGRGGAVRSWLADDDGSP